MESQRVKLKTLAHPTKSAYEWTARVRACSSVKFETRQNLSPGLKIVTHTVHVHGA